MEQTKPVATLKRLQCALAALHGVQDAQDGRDMEASTLYLVGSQPWRAYYDAYQRASKRPIMSLVELERVCRVPVAVAAHVALGVTWTFEDAESVLPAWQREDWVGE